jgi:hypothetical protein
MTKHVSCLALICILGSVAFAQTTTISYQGSLKDGATPATGTYEMQFTLFDAATDGNQIGPQLTLPAVNVAGGLFNVELDFGASAFTGPARWLQIAVRKSTDPPGFTLLSPRKSISSTPYALYALRSSGVDSASAGNSVINSINDSATTLTINDNRLPSNLVRLNPAAQQTGSAAANTDPVINVATSSASFPASLRLNNDGAFLLQGTTDDGTLTGGAPASGVGTRMFWHPRKGAFRAGHLNTQYTGVDDPLPINSSGLQWDEANIGYYSFAVGENNQASGSNSVALGRNASASGSHAFAMGDYAIASGAASVALGYHVSTNARQGSFVFGDRSTLDVLRAGNNHSANWRVSGGFRIFTTSNLSTGVTIQSGASVSNWGQTNAVISTSTGALLTTGGIWTNGSSRDLKHRFEDVDSRSILEKVLILPISTWSYKSQDDRFRHIGPMAQDFYKIFQVGIDDRSIGTVDTSGVALAAIQGLDQKVAEKTKALEAENAVLRARLEEQQKLLASLKMAVCSINAQAEVCGNK